MIGGLIGRKLGMTQVYTPQGVLVPVTVIQAGPCTVVATRRPEREGYAAAQVGFAPAGERVAVTGVSKGRGTAGVMKRHLFSGFPGSHGTHEYFRHGGSIGNRSFPGRVFKGKRMAGRYGAERVTTRNLEVIAVRPDDHLLLVRGAVPGARNGTVVVRKGREARK